MSGRAHRLAVCVGQTRIAAWGPPILLALLLAVLWQGLIDSNAAPEVLVPTPAGVLGYLASHEALLLRQTLITAWQALVGLALATALGLFVGSAVFASTLLRETIYPPLVVLQVLPKVAMAPLFVMWFGVGESARVAFAAFLGFFPVLLSMLSGLEQADSNALLLCRSLAATPTQIFWQVRLPYALPQVFAGVKVAATLAVTGVVIGEFMTADSGLGFLIVQSAARADESSMLSAIVMLCVAGLALFGAIAALQRVFNAWRFGSRRS